MIELRLLNEDAAVVAVLAVATDAAALVPKEEGSQGKLALLRLETGIVLPLTIV